MKTYSYFSWKIFLTRLSFLGIVLFLNACISEPSQQSIQNSISTPPKPPLPSRNELIQDSNRFKGLTSEGLVSLLGDPNFVRKDPPAEIWQYYGGDCVLDLFLYPNQDQMSVDYAELRGKTKGETSGCLNRIIFGRN
jgi:hypothetical protein